MDFAVKLELISREYNCDAYVVKNIYPLSIIHSYCEKKLLQI